MTGVQTCALPISGLGIRLLSVGLSGLVSDREGEASLFDPADTAERKAMARKTSALVEAEDRINTRFGRGAVQQGRGLYSKSRELFRKSE